LLLMTAILFSLGYSSAQYHDEEYVNTLKIAGTGVIDISTSVVDKRLALQYVNVMYGDGDIELDTCHQTSTIPVAGQGGNNTPLNLVETTRMTYSGQTPLVGMKLLNSRAFWGGMGASLQESFSVDRMDRVQKTVYSLPSPVVRSDGSTGPAGRGRKPAIPGYLVGFEVQSSFNGTWSTDSKWHKIFYKDIDVHEAFTGEFDVQKMVHFYEPPPAISEVRPCGIDC